MKKILIGMFIIIVFAVSFMGCSNTNGTTDIEDHTHSYTSKVVNPTCTSEGYTLYSCDCGDSYKDDIKSATGHKWIEGSKNYYCSKCNQSETDGFSFKKATMDGETCYTITNATSKAVVNGVLEIPRKYESLPVRGIMNWSFSEITKQVKKIIIHDNIKNMYSSLWHGTSIWTSDPETTSTLEEIVFDSTCSGMRIEAGAFENCPNLTKANIKSGMIKNVPVDAVTTTSGGAGDYIFKGTPYFKNNATKKNGLYYIADLLLYADLKEISTTVSIASGTIWLNPCLFNKCTSLKSITIPKSVTSIGNQAFNGCTSLETITFSGTVEEFNRISIGPSSFKGTKAKSITCSNGTVSSFSYNGYRYQIGE